MSDNVTPISPSLPDNNQEYKGYAYSLEPTAGGKWRTRLVIPMRPLKFERVFDGKMTARNWMQQVIDSLEVVNEEG